MNRALVCICALAFPLAACGPTAQPEPASTPEPTRAVGTTPTPHAEASPTTRPTSQRNHEGGQARAADLRLLPWSQGDIPLYSKVELELETERSTPNPFDPGPLEIRVRFHAPSGKESSIGAFWFQDFDPVTRQPRGAPKWLVRFTPTAVGEWRAWAEIETEKLESDPIEFHVVESNRPGFVRLDPQNPRYFAFDNGDFFFPIGLNMGWWGGSSDALTDYGRWLAAFDANGGNTIRVWMAPWSFSIEWADTPLGDYGRRMKQAWLLDQLLDIAESRDMYVILVLLTHCQYSEWPTCEWVDNPYNAALGGPLQSPGKFATDPQARALFQRRLNYIVNRWGYSPKLLAWEWWNEVNLTAISEQDLIPWLKEMDAYLQARDVNGHLTTNSYAIQALSPTWELPELDIVQRHEYADQIRASDRDLAGKAPALYREQADQYPGKPILLGEFGYSAANDGDMVESTGIHLHNGLWATAFSGFAGSGMYWWWDVYVERYNLWYHFKGLATFLEGVNLTRCEPFSPVEIHTVSGAQPSALGLGLRGEDILLWIRSHGYTTQAWVMAHAVADPGAFRFQPPPVEDHAVVLDRMGPGTYQITWFDPQRGLWMDALTLKAREGRLTIPLPTFDKDLAARITPLP